MMIIILLSSINYLVGKRYMTINIIADSMSRTIVIVYILLYSKILYYIIRDTGMNKMF